MVNSKYLFRNIMVFLINIKDEAILFRANNKFFRNIFGINS